MAIIIEAGKNGRRKILVRGFANSVKDNILTSACCVDCIGARRNMEKLKLQRGDVVVADQERNCILVRTDEFILSIETSFEIVGEKSQN